jgi:hypothetical protein
MKTLGIILMACIFLFGFSNQEIEKERDGNAQPTVARSESSGLNEEDAKDVIIGQRLAFQSQHLGESRTIYLRLPEKYEESAKRYPVLYILDGGDYFVPFAGMVQYMNYFDMPPTDCSGTRRRMRQSSFWSYA